MKTVSSKPHILLVINLPIGFIGFILLLMYPSIMHTLLLLFWLTAIAVTFRLFSNKSFSKSAIKLNTTPWPFLRIVLLQLSLMLIYVLFQHVASNLHITTNAYPPHRSFIVISYLILPWMSVALIVSRMQQQLQQGKERVFFSDAWLSNSNSTPAIILNGSQRFMLLFVLCIALCSISLPLINYVNHWLGVQQLYGGSAKSLLVVTLVLIASSAKFLGKLIEKIAARIRSAALLTLITLGLFCITLWIVQYLFSSLPNHPLSLPHWLQNFPSAEGRQLFGLLWWLGCIPFTSLYITRTCATLSPRKLISSILVLPLLLVIVYGCFHAQLSVFDNTAWIELAGIIAYILLLSLSYRHGGVFWLIQHYLPNSTRVKHRRLQPWFKNLVGGSALALFLLIPGKLSIFALLVSILMLPYMLMIILLPIKLAADKLNSIKRG